MRFNPDSRLTADTLNHFSYITAELAQLFRITLLTLEIENLLVDLAVELVKLCKKWVIKKTLLFAL